MTINTEQSKTPGGQRTILGEVAPLDTPFLVQIFPIYACNFKCGYCIYSLDKSKHGYISDVVSMNFELYKKCIDDLKAFPKKIKMLRFAGLGEPLLHKDITHMIAYAKKARVAEQIDIVTNASLLTKTISDELISAGLTKLRISLEGLSTADYEKNCKTKIDFEVFVENIRHFHENRGNTKVYIKIIDYMVQKESAKEKFHDIFDPICDNISIENLTPESKDIDFDLLNQGNSEYKPRNADIICKTEICSQPFYLMQINPDGNTVPCCAIKYPMTLGNVKEKSIKEIWQGKEWQEFLKGQLSGAKMACKVCSECDLYNYATYKEDVLDGYKKEILMRFE